MITITKKIFVFDIEYAGKGKDKVKIKPNEQLVKIAKIMTSEYKTIKLRDLFTYITLNKDFLISQGIEQSYLDKLKNRKMIFNNINGIYDIQLHITNSPYFKYANSPIYYIDFAYAILNFEVDENNKIHSIKKTDLVYSDKNIDFVPNIIKMCTAIGNNPNNIVTSYNVGVDYNRIMIALACSRFFSENDYGGLGAASAINTLIQLKQEKKIFDIRKVFVKLFSAYKGNKDKIEMSYVRWCIENGYITRSLNIKTQMEQVQEYYREVHSKQFEKKNLISENEIYTQKHSAKQDVKDLVELIKAKISVHKLDWSIYFDALEEDILETDFISIQLKNLFNKSDYKKELANHGYIIYGIEKQRFSDLSDSDIDNILEIPFNTKIRGYIDSTNTVLDLIRNINSMQFKNQFKNNNERMSYLKKELKILKDNQKKVLEKDEAKKIIENKVTEGIKDVTVSTLLENEILKYTKNQKLGFNIMNRIRFLLYYFLEQQKLIEFIKFLGEFYHAYVNVVKTDKELEIFNKAIEEGYTGIIEFIKKKQKTDDNVKMLKAALGEFANDDGGEFTYLDDVPVDFKKSRTKATKSMESLIKASTTIPNLSTAIERAITIALLEDKASKALKNSSGGGAYYDERIGDNSSPIGLDLMLYAKTSTTKTSHIANTLAIYYSFVPSNTYIYIAFSRLYGSKRYKSYIYHGVQYDYYLNLLREIIDTGTLGSAAWYIRRMNFKGRSLIQSTISGRTKFYQAISGEDKTKTGNTASPHARGIISSFEQHRKNRGRAGHISQISLNQSMFSEDKLKADAMLVNAFYNEAISLFTGSGRGKN